jgi:hypothetical protein
MPARASLQQTEHLGKAAHSASQLGENDLIDNYAGVHNEVKGPVHGSGSVRVTLAEHPRSTHSPGAVTPARNGPAFCSLAEVDCPIRDGNRSLAK